MFGAETPFFFPAAAHSVEAYLAICARFLYYSLFICLFSADLYTNSRVVWARAAQQKNPISASEIEMSIWVEFHTCIMLRFKVQSMNFLRPLESQKGKQKSSKQRKEQACLTLDGKENLWTWYLGKQSFAPFARITCFFCARFACDPKWVVLRTKHIIKACRIIHHYSRPQRVPLFRCRRCYLQRPLFFCLRLLRSKFFQRARAPSLSFRNQQAIFHFSLVFFYHPQR